MAEKHSCRWRRTAEEQAAQLRAKEVELLAHKEELATLASKVKELEHQLALSTKQIVGPKSEGHLWRGARGHLLALSSDDPLSSFCAHAG